MSNSETYIFDVEEQEFAEKVIELSDDKLIIVDFWAPWCGPCKQLTPILEKVVNSAGGKVMLAKINIDENQQIAAQLKIQSIPTVMAFKDKKIVNAFQGVIPEQKITEFIEKTLGEKLAKDNSVFYKSINDLMKKNAFEEAQEQLQEFIAENSEDTKAISLYLNCLISLSRFSETKDFVASLSNKIQGSPEIQSVMTNLKLKEDINSGPSTEEIEKKFEKNPNDLKIGIELSKKYFASNRTEESFELLLKLYSKKNDKEKAEIKKTLLKYFDALGNTNDFTKHYRKKFSSIMFS